MRLSDLTFDEFDEVRFPRTEKCEFDQIVERAVSRRGFIGSVFAMSTSAFVTGTVDASANGSPSRFGFDQVAANGLDAITLPNGYNWHVVVKWGDSLGWDIAGFDQGSPVSRVRMEPLCSRGEPPGS